MVMAGQPWGAGQEAPGGRAHVGREAAPVTACLMAATTGLGVEMCRCTRLRPSTPRAPSLLSLPFPGGGAGAARRRPPGRGKAEEAMATTRLEAPGQSRLVLAEATR